MVKKKKIARLILFGIFRRAIYCSLVVFKYEALTLSDCFAEYTNILKPITGLGRNLGISALGVFF